MVVTFYFDPLSQPCRALLMFMKANKIPVVEKELSLRNGEHKKQTFLTINPLGKVPALRDGAFTLRESVAIAKYLSARFELSDPWYPTDLQQKARVDEFLAWQHSGLRKHASQLVLDEVFMPLLFKKSIPQKQIEDDITALNNALDKLQNIFLKKKEFLCGDDISLADLFAACEISQTYLTGRNVLKNYPKLRAWYDLVRNTMSPFFEEVHTTLFSLRDQVIAGVKEAKHEEQVRKQRELKRRSSTDPVGEILKIELDDDPTGLQKTMPVVTHMTAEEVQKSMQVPKEKQIPEDIHKNKILQEEEGIYETPDVGKIKELDSDEEDYLRPDVLKSKENNVGEEVLYEEFDKKTDVKTDVNDNEAKVYVSAD